MDREKQRQDLARKMKKSWDDYEKYKKMARALSDAEELRKVDVEV